MVREIKANVLSCNQGNIKRALAVLSPIIVAQNILMEGIFNKGIKQNNYIRYFQDMYGILFNITS